MFKPSVDPEIFVDPSADYEWVVPKNVRQIYVIGCGGGSGGGAGAAGIETLGENGRHYWGCGGAGGFGATPKGRILDVIPGEILVISLGRGGRGGNARGEGGSAVTPEGDDRLSGEPGRDTIILRKCEDLRTTILALFRGSGVGGRCGAGGSFLQTAYKGGREGEDFQKAGFYFNGGGRGGADAVGEPAFLNGSDGHPCLLYNAPGGRKGRDNGAHTEGGGGGAGHGEGGAGGESGPIRENGFGRGRDAVDGSGAGGGGGSGNGPDHPGYSGGTGGGGRIEIYPFFSAL